MHKLCNGVSFFNNDFLRPVSQLGLKRNKILFQQDLPYFLHTFQTKKDNRFTILFQKNGKPLNQLKDFSHRLISRKSALRRLAIKSHFTKTFEVRKVRATNNCKKKMLAHCSQAQNENPLIDINTQDSQMDAE